MTEFGVFLFTIATGFVAAGLSGSLYRLVTKKPASFQLLSDSSAMMMAGVVTLVFAGPAVIMRNALRAQIIENRPPFWLLLSAMIAVFWSFMVGLFVLSILIART